MAEHSQEEKENPPRLVPSMSADEDCPECRVCRGPEEEDRPLLSPCRCSGSISFCHQECLLEWLKHSNKDRCELCSHKFDFVPVYAEDAPEFLPMFTLLRVGLRRATTEWLPLAARIILAVGLWLVVVPLVTSWLYRLWIHRSKVFVERLTLACVWGDLISGLIIAAAIILSFLSLMSFADFLRFHWDVRDLDGGVGHHHQQQQQRQQPQQQQQQQPQQPQQPQPQQGQGNLNVAPQNNNRNNDGEETAPGGGGGGGGGGEGRGGVDAAAAVVAPPQHPPLAERAAANAAPAAVAAPVAAPPSASAEPFEDNQLGGGGGEGGIEENILETRINHHEKEEGEEQAAELAGRDSRENGDEIHDGGTANPGGGGDDGLENFDNLDDFDFHDQLDNVEELLDDELPELEEDHEDDEEEDVMDVELHVAVDELLGIRGPIMLLLRNLLWLLAFNFAYLGLFAFVPFSIGSSVVSAGRRYNAEQGGDDFYSYSYSATATESPSSFSSAFSYLSSTPPSSFSAYSFFSLLLTSFTMGNVDNDGMGAFVTGEAAAETEAAAAAGTEAAAAAAAAAGAGAGAGAAPPPTTVLGMLAEISRTALEEGHTLQLTDLGTIALGYLVISLMIFMWRSIARAVCHGGPLRFMGRVRLALDCTAAVVKVGILLFLKMLLLPLLLGVCLDAATLALFVEEEDDVGQGAGMVEMMMAEAEGGEAGGGGGREMMVESNSSSSSSSLGSTAYSTSTSSDRIHFTAKNLVGSLLLHWVLGITFMLFVTVSVLQLREVLHPDIFASVIRPQEPHPDLLGSLLQESGLTHARRMVMSLAIYLVLLLLFVWLPTYAFKAAIPSELPVQLRLFYIVPQIQVPVELVVFHLSVLAFLERFKNRIGELQHCWLVWACRHLGLTRFLLPLPRLNTPPHQPHLLRRNRNRRNGRLRGHGDNDRTANVDLAHFENETLDEYGRGVEEEKRKAEEEREASGGVDDDEEGDDAEMYEEDEMVGEPLERPPPGWDDMVGNGGEQGMRWAWGNEQPSPLEQGLARRRRPSYAMPRLFLLFVGCWLSCLCLVLLGTALPLLLGRALFALLHTPPRLNHDPLAFAAGLAVTLTAKTPFLTAVAWATKPRALAAQVRRAVSRPPPPLGGACALALFGVLWLGLTPLFCGALFEATFVTPSEEWDKQGAAALAPLQDWGLGLVLLHAWALLTSKGYIHHADNNNNNNLEEQAPHVAGQQQRQHQNQNNPAAGGGGGDDATGDADEGGQQQQQQQQQQEAAAALLPPPRGGDLAVFPLFPMGQAPFTANNKLTWQRRLARAGEGVAAAVFEGRWELEEEAPTPPPPLAPASAAAAAAAPEGGEGGGGGVEGGAEGGAGALRVRRWWFGGALGEALLLDLAIPVNLALVKAALVPTAGALLGAAAFSARVATEAVAGVAGGVVGEGEAGGVGDPLAAAAAAAAAVSAVGLPPFLTLFRQALATCVILTLLSRLSDPVCAWLRTVHDSIRDEQYLVGLNLQNYHRKPSPPPAAAASSSSAPP